MINIKSSPVTIIQEIEEEVKYIRNNNQLRDYEIIFKNNNEEQRWFGSKETLLLTYPQAIIIKISKLKKK